MLRLRTLGGLSIESSTSMGNATVSRRPLALLALLAVKGRRGLSRDSIVALFWPESDAEHGRNSLSQMLSMVRRELDTDDVVLGPTELRVNSDVLACDVTELEERIAADELEAATRLYTGPFLDGVFLKNAPEFERWVDHERSRLEHMQGYALERLAARATASGDHVSAVRFRRERTRLAPNDSRAARELMEALVASGDPAGALDHYRVHHALLRDDLGLEPDATLVELSKSVRCGMIRSVDAPNGKSASAPVHADIDETTARQAPREVSVGDEPVQLGGGTAILRAKPRRVLLPITAAVMVVAGAAAAWAAKSARFGSGPPKPPAYDSLRLRIVTASVQSDPADSTLARGVRNAALAEMARDPWLFVVTPEAWRSQAPFIGLDEAVLAQPDTIRKYARKTRTHAIVDFGLSRAANGFVITAEARSASTDSSLDVIAEAAAGPLDLPAAMARLGHALRERVVAARSTLPPTQWSLNTTDQPAQAIELYVEGRSEADRGNYVEASRRARAAVAVDSTFAQAWRLVHSSLYNAHLSVDDQLNAISAAFRFSNRVRAPYWRLDIVAAYYRAIGDPERALVFYDSIARLDPARNVNAGLSYGTLRRYDLATRGYRRYVDASPRRSITGAHPPLVSSLLAQGKVAEARHEVAEMMRIDSVNSRTFQSRAFVFSALREWDSLSVLGKSYLGSARTATDSQPGLRWVGDAAICRGQFAVFDSMARLTAMLIQKYGSSGDYLAGQLHRARLRATVAGDTARARAIADSGLAVARWQSLKPMDRPYLAMLSYLASVRDVQRGSELAREWSSVTPKEFKRRDSLNVLVGRGELALAAGNAREALRFFRLADVRDCEPCFFPRYARAFDALSERDSARVWFERYAAASAPWNAPGDAIELAHTYRRLGELYEERRDVRTAVSWYERFAALWATSDTPTLQAQVRDVRDRVDKLRQRGR